MKINSTPLLALIILFSSCHKNSSYLEPRILIDSRLSGMEFKPGSYWVYLNDSTQKTDCTYVVKTETGYYEQNQSPSGNCISSVQYYNISYHDKDSVNLNDYETQSIIRTYVETTFPVNKLYSNWDILIYYYPKPGELIPLIFDTIQHIDSLKVGSNTFKQIQRAIIDSTYDCYYTCKSVGVVKKVLHKSSHQGTWNLLRWRVEK